MIYRFHLEAEAEHYEAVAFYQSQRAGLGEGYLVEFEQVMACVVQAPQAFRVERKPDIRRAHLKRFPHTVIYRELEGAVQILAIAHKRRRPGYWSGRLSD
ncbi:MAG: type II toxin-antitoxin system RelE/ParE family toxin [Nevskia sp.]|nr:type II toxin-antitoxin system RelE/ParE family toxin [Nevskia sp.]